MLQQQAEDDPSAAVRQGVVRNLVLLLDADPDVAKAHTLEALLLHLSQDSAEEVSELAVSRLLPAVSAWLLRCSGTHRIHSSLLPAVAARLMRVLGRAALGQGGFRPLTDDDRWRAGVLLRLFTGLVPGVRQAAARSVPQSLLVRSKAQQSETRRAAGDAEETAGAAEVSKAADYPSSEGGENAKIKTEGVAGDTEMDVALSIFAAAPPGTHRP
jgi:hypothetical protein